MGKRYAENEEALQWERTGSDPGGLMQARVNPTLAAIRPREAWAVKEEGWRLYKEARDR